MITDCFFHEQKAAGWPQQKLSTVLQNGSDFFCQLLGVPLVLPLLCCVPGTLGPPHTVDFLVSAFPPLQFWTLIEASITWRGEVSILLLSQPGTDVYSCASFQVLPRERQPVRVPSCSPGARAALLPSQSAQACLSPLPW